MFVHKCHPSVFSSTENCLQVQAPQEEMEKATKLWQSLSME